MILWELRAQVFVLMKMLNELWVKVLRTLLVIPQEHHQIKAREADQLQLPKVPVRILFCPPLLVQGWAWRLLANYQWKEELLMKVRMELIPKGQLINHPFIISCINIMVHCLG